MLYNNALRSVLRAQTPSIYSFNNNYLPKYILVNRKPSSSIRFAQSVANPDNSNNNSEKMNQQKKEPESKTGDIMSSFGEGYATRSDEEGFGGVYGGNQYLSKDDEDQTVRGKDPEFDYSQGSEVKETEKARNQEKVASS